ncbi:DUF1120 domain-containing protein [Serratia fonticola]|uniref:DUF1120 domain-containing protein n=1 Tax=Serratia fonticola TaxID=47917 RepID=UPI0036F2EFF5
MSSALGRNVQQTITTLDEKQLDFSITCYAPAKVAIKATSQRGDSAVSQVDGKLSTFSSTGEEGSQHEEITARILYGMRPRVCSSTPDSLFAPHRQPQAL